MWFLRIVSIGMIALAIYSIKNPVKSYMFGRRWMYNEEPEPSEMLQDIIKIQWIVIAIVFTIIFLLSFLMNKA